MQRRNRPGRVEGRCETRGEDVRSEQKWGPKVNGTGEGPGGVGMAFVLVVVVADKGAREMSKGWWQTRETRTRLVSDLD